MITNYITFFKIFARRSLLEPKLLLLSLSPFWVELVRKPNSYKRVQRTVVTLTVLLYNCMKEGNVD